MNNRNNILATPGAVQLKKQPVASPVYRPQTAPKVLQGKLMASQQAHSHNLLSLPSASSPSCPPAPHKCLQLRTADKQQLGPGRTLYPHINSLPRNLVQPRMQTPGRHPVANSIRTPNLIGGNAIQPMMNGNVIQAWPEWGNYIYNGLVSLSSAGAIATGIATACQASGLGFGIPALIGAVPAIIKAIIDRVSKDHRSYKEETSHTPMPIITDLASQIATLVLPAIMAIIGANAATAAIAIGTISTIIAGATWGLMAYYTDN